MSAEQFHLIVIDMRKPLGIAWSSKREPKKADVIEYLGRLVLDQKVNEFFRIQIREIKP